jgi:hypothetical protein
MQVTDDPEVLRQLNLFRISSCGRTALSTRLQKLFGCREEIAAPPAATASVCDRTSNGALRLEAALREWQQKKKKRSQEEGDVRVDLRE